MELAAETVDEVGGCALNTGQGEGGGEAGHGRGRRGGGPVQQQLANPVIRHSFH